MAIRINAKECCGEHCQIASDAHESNTSVEEEIREEGCCSDKGCRCSDEWPNE